MPIARWSFGERWEQGGSDLCAQGPRERKAAGAEGRGAGSGGRWEPSCPRAWLSDVQVPGSTWERPAPPWLWFSAGPVLSPKGGGERLAGCASLEASPRPHGAQPAPGPGCHQTTPAPRAWAQAWTSDLTAAKTESERPDPHGGRGAGSRKVTGRPTRGLTCAAASSASWSGLRLTWAFSGRWRRHLQNLGSGRRHAAAAGARWAALGSPKPGVPAHAGRLGERRGPGRPPRDAFCEVDPIPKPGLALPRPAPRSGGLEQISLQERPRPGALGAGVAGKEAAPGVSG